MKHQGEIAEIKFLLECTTKGIKTSIPFGDNYKYDIITDSGRLNRVQIKSTAYLDNRDSNSYRFIVAHGRDAKKKYTKDDVDFIALYVIPEDVWYIIPIEAVSGIRIRVFPHVVDSRSKYEKYKQAWDLL